MSQTFARRVPAPRRRARDEHAREGRRRFASSAFARARESTRATRRDLPEDARARPDGGDNIDASLRWRRADDVRLVLARHAKSDRSDPMAEDWARGLRPRGRRRAKRLAKRLTDRFIAFEPDVVITSDAVRCVETLACMGDTITRRDAPTGRSRGERRAAAIDDGVHGVAHHLFQPSRRRAQPRVHGRLHRRPRFFIVVRRTTRCDIPSLTPKIDAAPSRALLHLDKSEFVKWTRLLKHGDDDGARVELLVARFAHPPDQRARGRTPTPQDGAGC